MAPPEFVKRTSIYSFASVVIVPLAAAAGVAKVVVEAETEADATVGDEAVGEAEPVGVADVETGAAGGGAGGGGFGANCIAAKAAARSSTPMTVFFLSMKN